MTTTMKWVCRSCRALTLASALGAALSSLAAPSQTAMLTSVDTAGNVGEFSSISIGADGLPVLAYRNTQNGHLKVAKCGNLECSSGNTITTVDTAGVVGEYASVAVGADGLPAIAYYDQSNGNLKLAKCGNPACSAANTITTIDSEGDVGRHTAIAIGADGLPVISYYDASNGNLKVLKCGNTACNTNNAITTVDDGEVGNVGQWTSIKIAGDGLPVISYYDASSGDLKVAKCGNASCSAGNTLFAVDAIGNVGYFTSMAIGADGLPIISYYDLTNTALKVARCGNPSCTSGNTVATIDSAGETGRWTSIAIGVDGLPVIAYLGVIYLNFYPTVARCGDPACASGNTITTIDPTGFTSGYWNSLATGSDGLPIVSYYDSFKGDLVVAKCLSISCEPLMRVRDDMDGDGRSDVLWRNSSTGENYLYPMDGTSILPGEGYLRTVPDPTWRVAGVGDFDGNGRADILWRNTSTGENYIYLMAGTTISAEGYIRTVADQSWQVAGVGDFDGDGGDDILWRNGFTGENYLYPMQGLAIKPGEGYLRTVAQFHWQVRGIADFDGDGKADVLWRQVESGENYLYPMDGTAIKPAEGYLRTVADTDWFVAAAADFDGDGRADILWRHESTGESYLYPMNGTSILAGEGYLRTVSDPFWHVVQAGDFDGDGKADLLWRNFSSGENYLWPMDGRAIKPGEGFLRTVPDTNWAVVPPLAPWGF